MHVIFGPFSGNHMNEKEKKGHTLILVQYITSEQVIVHVD